MDNADCWGFEFNRKERKERKIRASLRRLLQIYSGIIGNDASRFERGAHRRSPEGANPLEKKLFFSIFELKMKKSIDRL